MGLRTASVRHPDAVVMAPALTESTQTQNFKLPPTSRSASPINNLANENAFYANEEACVKGGDCVLKGKQLNNAFDNLNTLALASELLKIEDCLGATSRASDITQTPYSPQTSRMNNCSTLMEDQADKMGIQKAGLDNVSALLKDKSVASDMDQMLNNLSTDLPMPAAEIPVDIGQNLDDLMQVVKSFEAGTSERTSSDLGAESDTIFPLTSNDLASNLELFNDMMNISMEEDGSASLKEIQAKELITEINATQIKLEKKLEYLLRRLRKLQIRDMGIHFSGEVAGVFEHVHRLLKRLKDNLNNDSPMQISDADQSNSSLLMEQLTSHHHEKMKPISQSSSRNLVRKLEMSTLLQANFNSRQKHTPRYFGSGSLETNSFRTTTTPVTGTITFPKWPQDNKKDLEKVSGSLYSEISLVQQELDSEATASSSGGESCDEMQNYNNPTQQTLSIQKRAAWKYATERAAIASRWTWLQAQISDLEYRIRQHGDLHRQIRSNKGSVKLGGLSPPHSVPSSPTTVNGYRGQLPGASVKGESAVNGAVGNNGTDYQCARTRPLCNFKRRKLLQTTGLHAVSKKAARPSNIRCGCVQPSVPCTVCTGRTDPTYPRDLPEHLSKAERIALLDPGFHPVFSLPEDVSVGIHLEAIMKTPEWQQRRSNLKALKAFSKVDRIDKSNLSLDRPKKLDHRRRKYSRLLKSSTPNTSDAKIKPKMRGKRGRHPSLSRLSKKKQSGKLTMGQIHIIGNNEGVDEEVESYSNSSSFMKYESPSSSPLLATQTISGLQKRNRINSYDIDNIVIPYSVAASTRVEKLPYKEILTPKWRIADVDAKYDVKNNGIVKNPSQDSDAEDLSEDAVITRHDKCEHDEKKKFLSYLKLPIGYGRSRSHKRTDSRAESSGGNTPDPMSPYPADTSENMASPITSPPATPMSSNTDENSMQSISILRRRTISQSRWTKERDVKEEGRCNTPEHVEVPPFDKRLFPLPEDVYEKMLKGMPESHKNKTNIHSQDSLEFTPNLSDNEYKVDFHDSESTESAFGDEDPNDPEWIAMERVKDRYNKRFST